jgi:hypothetical protein
MGLMSDMADSGAMDASMQIKKEIERRLEHQRRYGKQTTKSLAVINELEELRRFAESLYAHFRDR